ncbi:MAG: Asp-tRNA(Asn)/Glu-tRNA(Gln) amidotransferase subunit GatC [Planctomycetes bacterium]|nr:Asp-tRNA(Asn)/Glu-tRNA(Gln) amidotransferase subunit GatC [Planctomycetota bacterium]
MSDKITEQQVRHVAKLARLKITDEQVKTFTPQLNAILTYVAQLEQLDTSHVEPLAHCLPVSNVLRDDTIQPSLSNADALANAPAKDGEFFTIHKVLGNAGA